MALIQLLRRLQLTDLGLAQINDPATFTKSTATGHIYRLFKATDLTSQNTKYRNRK